MQPTSFENDSTADIQHDLAWSIAYGKPDLEAIEELEKRGAKLPTRVYTYHTISGIQLSYEIEPLADDLRQLIEQFCSEDNCVYRFGEILTKIIKKQTIQYFVDRNGQIFKPETYYRASNQIVGNLFTMYVGQS